MTQVNAKVGGPIRVRTRVTDKHVVQVGEKSAILTDEQLAMLGRICISRGVPDA